MPAKEFTSTPELNQSDIQQTVSRKASNLSASGTNDSNEK